MKQTKLLMGMPITLEVLDRHADKEIFSEVYSYLTYVDNTYSTYKQGSEISRINNGLPQERWSDEMKSVLKLCEQTKRETHGYFDIEHGGRRDPSGLVKGWAIYNAAQLLLKRGLRNYYLEAGGDIQVHGRNKDGKPWRVGIRSPFNRAEIVKVVALRSEGIATSGTYIRGQHVYDPHNPTKPIEDVASLTVLGPTVFDADRFATAAFAMGARGITFIESLDGYEGYMIDANQRATVTSGFERYVVTG